MPLVAAEDGIVQFVKQPGVSLEPGDIFGILTLDDPARVKHAKPFEGLLPPIYGSSWYHRQQDLSAFRSLHGYTQRHS
jgi:hypothetical protein